MKALNLPEFPYAVRRQNDRVEIFDVIRKKYVALTPEEWVRQHVVHYLLDGLGYPRALTRIESGLLYNRLAKRSDIVIFNREIKPFLVVECKSFEVRLTQKVMNQAAMYNRQLHARLLVITNGLQHFCVEYAEDGTMSFLPEIPAWEVISGRT